MAKLGYTWYPKDWGNSEKVFELNLIERGLYRELIDMAMLNDNKTQINMKVWARKFGSNENEIEAILITLQNLDLIEINNDSLFVPSCESRLNLSRAGKKGKPSETSILNLKNQSQEEPISKPISKPISEQKKEKRKESKIKINEKSFTKKQLTDYFLNLFNFHKSEIKRMNANHRSLTPTDENNLIKLIKAGYTSDDFVHGMLAMDESEWVTENNMFTPAHFLRNENFEKYVNTKLRKHLKPIGSPITFES